MTHLPGTAWLAAAGFQNNLYHELAIDPARTDPTVVQYGDLVYRKGTAPLAFWHRTRLEKPFIAEFSSIKEAADILRSIQRNWALYPFAAFRRSALISEKLPKLSIKPREFPFHVPDSPMGLWTLLDNNHLFASAETSSPFPLGEIRFVEDHENPPSRAYLKMFEALAWVSHLVRRSVGSPASRELVTPPELVAPPELVTPPGSTGSHASTMLDTPPGSLFPGPGSRCVDAGACPGGWTWALRQLGAQVTAIDRSELDPRLMADPGVRFIKHDAFTLKPEDFGPQDWVCSDVICYPPRLYEWILKWLESGLCGNFICTIKMQGPADHETTRAFAAIPGSTVVHLTANKNELTWIRLKP